MASGLEGRPGGRNWSELVRCEGDSSQQQQQRVLELLDQTIGRQVVASCAGSWRPFRAVSAAANYHADPVDVGTGAVQ